MLRLVYLKRKLAQHFFLTRRGLRIEVDKLQQAVADFYGRRRRSELMELIKAGVTSASHWAWFGDDRTRRKT